MSHNGWSTGLQLGRWTSRHEASAGEDPGFPIQPRRPEAAPGPSGVPEWAWSGTNGDWCLGGFRSSRPVLGPTIPAATHRQPDTNTDQDWRNLPMGYTASHDQLSAIADLVHQERP